MVNVIGNTEAGPHHLGHTHGHLQRSVRKLISRERNRVQWLLRVRRTEDFPSKIRFAGLKGLNVPEPSGNPRHPITGRK